MASNKIDPQLWFEARTLRARRPFELKYDPPPSSSAADVNAAASRDAEDRQPPSLNLVQPPHENSSLRDIQYIRLAWFFPDSSLASYSLHPTVDAARKYVEKWAESIHEMGEAEKRMAAHPRPGLGESVMVQNVFVDPASDFGTLMDAALEAGKKTRANFTSLYIASSDKSEIWYGIRSLRTGETFECPYTPLRAVIEYTRPKEDPASLRTPFLKLVPRTGE